MSEIHIGPHTRDEPRKIPHDTTGTFDREIDLKAIAWLVGGLVAIALVVQVLVLWTIRGFERFDEKRDVRPSPIEAAIPQGPPPGPPLQTDDEKDMRDLREEEDSVLDSPAWVDPAQGRVRVPIDVAMEVIASRGLGAEVVGGAPHPPGPPLPTALPSPGRGGKEDTSERDRERSLLPSPGGQGVRLGEGPGVRGPAPQESPL